MRLGRILPRGRLRRIYLGISLVDALGSGMFLPVTVLYLTQIVGLSAVRVGVGVAISGAAGIAATPVAGALLDRFDSRALTAVCFALCGAGFVAYTRIDSFATFIVVGSLIAVFEAVARGARKMLAFALAAGDDRITLLAYERSTRNVGYGLGGLLASVAVASGSREAYVAVLLANAASYAGGAVAVMRLPKASASARDTARGGYGAVLRDRVYVGLSALSGVLWVNDSILKVGLAIWLVKRTTVPGYAVGLLFTLNTVLVVALQVRASRGSGTPAGFGRAFRRSGTALLACCVLFALAAGRPVALATLLLVAAVCALTVGELLVSAGQWGMTVVLSPEPLRGRYLAVASTATSLQAAVGPAALSAVIIGGGSAGWLGVGLVLLLAGLLASALAARATVPEDVAEPGVAEAA